MTKPESKVPLSRYELDKNTLNLQGMSTESTDRLYKALYVHSTGFFELINELSKNVEQGRQALRANIWRVFQILLECACKTDY